LRKSSSAASQLFSLQFFQKQLQAMMEQTTRNQVSVTKQVELGMAIPAPEEQDEIVRRSRLA